MATTIPLKMTRRARSGARSRQYHAVPSGWNRYRRAVCGTRPSAPGAFGTKGIMGKSGWSEKAGETVTCTRCLETLAARKAA